MTTVIPKNSRYVPIQQQPYCCVPSCIQMVLLRHKLPLAAQELIGWHLGLIVPPSYKEFFFRPRVSRKPPPAGYGTRVKKFDINNGFVKLAIPFRCHRELIDRFPDPQSLMNRLKRAEKTGEDVLICFENGILYKREGTPGGHVCVFDRIIGGKIRFIDPDRGPKWRTTTIAKLHKAMSIHGPGKLGGLWVLSKNPEKKRKQR